MTTVIFTQLGPVVHREPVPQAVGTAIASVAFAHEYWDFVLVVLMMLHFILRAVRGNQNGTLRPRPHERHPIDHTRCLPQSAISEV